MEKLVRISLIAIAMLVACHSSKHLRSDQKRYNYIEKVEFPCSELNGRPIAGYKLTLPPYVKSTNYTVQPCTYEMDKVFAGYPNDKKVAVLQELLSFEGDTSLCSKSVCRYGYTTLPKPKTETYTTQIDALYLFTLLTASSFSPNYCPYPVLVDVTTGEEINSNSAKVKEVFGIYRQWFEDNKNRNFENYNLPLRNSSRYEWYGADKKKAFIFSDTFKIKQLDASAIVIGNCKE